jgi:predicted CoA-binding protein
MKAYPVGRVKEIDGNPVFENLAALPEKVEAISIITPPAVTDQVVADAIAAGVKHIWMQPGAESPAAIQKAQDAGINVIHGGPCVLVELG